MRPLCECRNLFSVFKDEGVMKVRNSSSLLDLRSYLSNTERNQKNETSITEATNQANASATAVKIDPQFNSSKVDESSDPRRKARVAELRQQVQDGTYNPDSSKVAQAVIRDLFV